MSEYMLRPFPAITGDWYEEREMKERLSDYDFVLQDLVQFERESRLDDMTMLDKYGYNETNPNRLPRHVFLRTKPTDLLPRLGSRELRVHQSVEVGPYRYEIDKPSKGATGTRRLQYGPQLFEQSMFESVAESIGLIDRPRKVATTTKTDGEISDTFSSILESDPFYSLAYNNCQHVSHKLVHAIADPAYPVNMRPPPTAETMARHPTIARHVRRLSDLKFMAEAVLDTFSSDPNRDRPLEKWISRQQRENRW